MSKDKKLEQYYSVLSSPPLHTAQQQKRPRNTTSLDNESPTIMSAEGGSDSKIDLILSMVQDMKVDMKYVKEKVGALEVADHTLICHATNRRLYQIALQRRMLC